jgi:DNA-binding XRE family transcriptional regulator
VLEWLKELRCRNRKAFNKCLFLLSLLEEFGSDLRRPRADLLRDGVYELRTEVGNVQYRLLYGFIGKKISPSWHTRSRKKPQFRTAILIWQRIAWREFAGRLKSTPQRGMSLMARKTTNALDIVRHETGIDARTDSNVQAYRRPFEIAQMIYDARTAAGLTQKQLADMIGTKQPVISQLENADYEGQSLAMLERIAEALNLEVQLRLVPTTSAR